MQILKTHLSYMPCVRPQESQNCSPNSRNQARKKATNTQYQFMIIK